MTDKPRLIEVAFPLQQASLASVHEKNVRHGHISTLHIWPARRPLAACRAALLCTLLPDPGDAQKRQELLDLIGGKVVEHVVASEDEEGNSISEEKETVEGGVLVWGNENDPAMDTLRAAIKDFYDGNAPNVLDPFAGGGAIPLEAMRLGCAVTSADLNPVAWFIQKCTLDYPQRFAGRKWPLPGFVREWPDFVEDFIAGKVKKRRGQQKPHFSDPKQIQLLALQDADLAWQVRAWGRWVLERARQELARRYPTIGGEQTVAYLWARTGRDPQTTGRIPLLKTFWLCPKKGKRAALLPIPLANGTGVTFKLLRDADLAQAQRVIDENECLQRWEVTAEGLEDFIKNGTMNRAGVWSPCGGRPGVIALTMEDLRRQGRQGLLGAQMTGVVVEGASAEGKRLTKRYRLPTELEISAAEVEAEDLQEAFAEIPFGIPTEPMPEIGALGIRVALYGFRQWRDMFLGRQLLALSVFARQIRKAVVLAKEEQPDTAAAIAGYLTCTFGKMLDYENVCCAWYTNNEQITHLFNRFAIPIKWDFAEASPIGGASGSWESMLSSLTKSVATGVGLSQNLVPPVLLVRSATTPDAGSLDAVVTDPPYYGAMPYSDLMDFFYVWQRRILADLDAEHGEKFGATLPPKWDEKSNDGELVDDPSRFGGDSKRSKAAYEGGMARAFAAGLARLRPRPPRHRVREQGGGCLGDPDRGPHPIRCDRHGKLADSN